MPPRLVNNKSPVPYCDNPNLLVPLIPELRTWYVERVF